MEGEGGQGLYRAETNLAYRTSLHSDTDDLWDVLVWDSISGECTPREGVLRGGDR